MVPGSAIAEDYLPASRYAEQRAYSLQYPEPQYTIQNPVLYGQTQQYAFLDINQQQQKTVPSAASKAEQVDDDYKARSDNENWKYEVGAGLMYGPAYEGSDKNEMQAIPNFSVDYKNGLFFANIFDGIGSYPIQGRKL
ncbi:MAG: hypothetical protein CMM93_02715 [Rickettsiales bacterium]|nr:hypothetical protein [Rickettsiales bacterium]|tara:strand:+ start:128 stop:541 length:414 start_codon:yes stop_codon:yes gene_type:complete